MKLLILADPSSSHTIKWINSLIERGHEIFLFGLSGIENDMLHSKVNLITWNINSRIKELNDGNIIKACYLFAVPQIKKLISKIKPEIIHAHYASSYGLLGALSEFHPFYISVWGNDIFDFPKKSNFHKNLLKYILRKADIIFSTSKILKLETEKYTDNEVVIIPFGVDTDIFKPQKVKSIFSDTDLVLGTVKSLYPKYGIEYLIKSFRLIKDYYPSLAIKLLIVGGGILERKLKSLALELNLFEDIVFTGRVPFSQVVDYHNMITIEIFPSLFESFGVSVLEASACSKPVIATRVGGFKEVVDDGVTGILIKPENPESIAEAVKIFLEDSTNIKKFGDAGRNKVLTEYRWELCVDKLDNFYNKSYLVL